MMKKWIIVDDSLDETSVLASQLTVNDVLNVEVISASNAQERMEDRSLEPDGVLMDVDLSNEAGLRFTGPGLAQSIRVAQGSLALRSFPLVRFSARDKVRASIGSDSSSDDVFDLKIEKDGLGEKDRLQDVRRRLLAVSEVYDRTVEQFPINEYFNVSEEQWEIWGHQAAVDEMSVADLLHLRAGRLIRMLVHPGIFINEGLLAIRLGIDKTNSRDWVGLRENISGSAYRGVASEHLALWWARGVEDWWQSFNPQRPLAGTTIDERLSVLRRVTGLDLVALQMPEGSLGSRPWRSCMLSWEVSGELVAVDPSKAVKIIPRRTLPGWMDPLVAALGPANRNSSDRRLDRRDLGRLMQMVGEE